MLPGDISDGQYRAVSGEYRHAVTSVVNAESYVVADLCFQLRLIVSLYSADGWLEERPHLSGGGGEPYHISYGDSFPDFYVVAVRFRTWYAQDTASAHKTG